MLQFNYNNDPQVSTTGWYSLALACALPSTATDLQIKTNPSYGLRRLNCCGSASGAQRSEIPLTVNPNVIASGCGGRSYGRSEHDIDEYYDVKDLSGMMGFCCCGCRMCGLVSGVQGVDEGRCQWGVDKTRCICEIFQRAIAKKEAV